MKFETKRTQVATAVMLIAYFTMYSVVTSAPVTESAFYVTNPSSAIRNLLANPSNEVFQNPQTGYPYYQYPYQYIPNPYYEYPRGGYYYPLNGYQTGVDGFPQNAQNGYPIYPQYGYQSPYNYYPYGYGK
ncbi:hypothetical protein L798_03069 [Zootermopsis nevadensis]|uniref:Uncharacterized protein n=1 Tax=Zootermopsis nevadensis TaxID=136037 RepID=A0A067RN57_ZOONE|nr:hypothetical protein L798_03069 [Zootermopsis nevadensis]